MYPCFAAWQQVSLVHKDRSGRRGEIERREREGGGGGRDRRREGAMKEAG